MFNRSAIIRSVVLTMAILAMATDSLDVYTRAEPPADRGASSSVAGITAPKQSVTLGTIQAGRIANLFVSEGQAVARGTLVASLDHRVQKLRVERARSQAESTLDVELATARAQYARRECDRLQALEGDRFASAKELLDAELVAKTYELERSMAILASEQARRDFEREKTILDDFEITAPFDGYVTQILKHAGEVLNEREGILVMVQLDPLEVVLDCSLDLASSVRVGDRVPVEPVDRQWETRDGEIIFASRAADAASQTFKVKLVVANENGEWMSGMKVRVNFDQAAAGEPRTPTPMTSR